MPKSSVEAVNELMKDRHQLVLQLKQQLHKAQERMNRFADEKRVERSFEVGDWVFLKLQPYRQVSVTGVTHSKLNAKFYGPFQILEKIGTVAYKLQLPLNSQIHPVFHVSQLKPRIGKGEAVVPNLPVLGPERGLRLVPVAILDRKIVKRGNAPVAQILVKWSNTTEEEATWEYYEEIKKYPDFILGDKQSVKEMGVSATSVNELIAVAGFESVNTSSDKEKPWAKEMGRAN
jgi:Chromo (CHRromatin Organisation MOdifier) domain